MKTLYLLSSWLFLALMLPIIAVAQCNIVPLGATISNPINIGSSGCGLNFSDVSRYNTPDQCYGNQYGQPSDDIYWRFDMAAPGTAQVTTCGPSSTTSYFYLLNAQGQEITRSTSCGFTQNLAAGTYYLVGEKPGTGTGMVYLNLRVAAVNPPPVGATISNPIDVGNLQCNVPFSSTLGNISSNCYGNEYGDASDDIYYRFTLVNTMTVDLSNCGSQGIPTNLYLLNVNGGLLASNRGLGLLCPGSSSASMVQTLNPGVYYLVTEGVSNTGWNRITTTINGVINGAPSLQISPQSASVDAGYSVSLTATGACSYTWTPATGLDRTTGSTVVATPAATTTYTVVGTSNSGQTSAPVSVTVTVTQNKNYVITNTPTVRGIQTVAQVGALTADTRQQKIVYYDELGRATQEVITRANTDYQDVVTPIAYDALGRPAVKYLPYAGGSAGTGNNGLFQANAMQQQAAFYDVTTTGDQIANDDHPYERTVYEPSPLNRIVKQGAVGQAWQPAQGSDHTKKLVDRTNEFGEVRRFNYDHATGIVSSAENLTWFDGLSGRVIVKDSGLGSSAFRMQREFTLEAWIYPTANKEGIIINKEGEYEIARFPDGTIRWAVANSSNHWEWINSGGTAPLNQWTHVAFSFNANTNRAQVYLNRVAVGNSFYVNSAVGDADPGNNDLWIGGRPCCSTFFQGYIKDVLVLPESRKLEEIGTELSGPYAPISQSHEKLETGPLSGGATRQSKPAFYKPGTLKSAEVYDEQDALTVQYSTRDGLIVLKRQVAQSGIVCATKGENNGGDLVLQAPAGMRLTGIQSATFGTVGVPGASCTDFRFGSCSADVTTQVRQYVASQLRQNTQRLDVRINIDYLGDPCVGSSKTLMVVATYAPLDGSGDLLTHYVYDDFNRLRLVISPAGMQEITVPDAWSPTAAALSDFSARWCFRYDYDGQGRVTEKQVPGSGAVRLAYNQRNQVVLTQDAKQAATGKWSFAKYDELGRIVLTGITSLPGISQGAVQAALDSPQEVVFSEKRDNSDTGYSLNESYPRNIGEGDLLTVTYYDDHNYNALANPSLNFTGSGDRAVATRGLVTGNKQRQLSNGSASGWLLSKTYHDPDFRPLQTISSNGVGGTERVTTTYDFIGNVVASVLDHTRGGLTRTIRTEYSYDHMSRLEEVRQNTDGQGMIILARNEYNRLGQLVDKKLHSTDQGINFLQSVDYRYNIRGWLTNINNRNLSNDPNNRFNDADPNEDDLTKTDPDLFGMELMYNANHNLPSSVAQFDGNISEVMWRTGNTATGQTLRGYSYKYDQFKRITEAQYRTHEYDPIRSESRWDIHNTNYTIPLVRYDANGNILELQRKGLVSAPGNATQYGDLDALNYSYRDATGKLSNRLQSVDDTQVTAATHDFEDNNVRYGSSGQAEFGYDANGNLEQDLNKGIYRITYNILNLPEKIEFGSVSTPNGNRIEYTYTAGGVKLQKRVYTNNALTNTTDYTGTFVYEQGVPSFASTAEGRVIYQPNATRLKWKYEYHLKDHLGNLRFAFRDSNDPSGNETQITAGMEPSNAEQEEHDFEHIAETRQQDAQQARTGRYVARLSAAEGRRVGPSITLNVQPGDSVTADVYGRYDKTPVGALLRTSALAAGSQVAAHPSLPEANKSSLKRAFPYVGLSLAIVPQLLKPRRSELPNAFLRYELFDQDSQLVKVIHRPLQRIATEEWQHLEAGVKADSAGYVRVSLINESGTPAYFDDLALRPVDPVTFQENHYDPWGLNLVGIETDGVPNSRFQYNGKEKQEDFGLNWLDYGARMYDAQLGRWHVVDPMTEKREWLTPYNFVQNNPINRFDPNGLTDFTFNKRTGEVKQVGEINNEPDRILRTNKDGEILKRKNGDFKVAVSGIEQGILKDGQNFRNKDNIIETGGKNQPSVEGVKSFALKLSEYVGVEIKGFSYSSSGNGKVTDMLLGKYMNNTNTKSYGGLGELHKKYEGEFSYYNVLQEFHTHPDGKLGSTASAPNMSNDVSGMQRDKPGIPNASFIILYRALGQATPQEYDYTHEYRPRK
ncbi:hypothetical protein KLP40_18055 [Hymenobacter sp. NST-14]|uniref:DUF6443 domain-containing protein n=1 Tax=Hymenobacter piscis TaxID=2839984 RepID=UPI001C019627|nr:DUF6443 domain-containing protein [Hymenobacter piscis]MBT9395076.1 hypothetical protein [Hymenobacter piscis]